MTMKYIDDAVLYLINLYKWTNNFNLYRNVIATLFTITTTGENIGSYLYAQWQSHVTISWHDCRCILSIFKTEGFAWVRAIVDEFMVFKKTFVHAFILIYSYSASTFIYRHNNDYMIRRGSETVSLSNIKSIEWTHLPLHWIIFRLYSTKHKHSQPYSHIRQPVKNNSYDLFYLITQWNE